MALDFPNSPTLNQTFTAPNGTIWLWDGVKWTAITSTSPYVGGGNVGRNLLHNPLFNVAQRGVGPWTGGGYTLDRWTGSQANDAASYSQQVLVDADRTAISDEAATKSLQNVFTGNAAAGSFTFMTQWLEGVQRLGGKSVTVSFWAKAAAGTPKLGVNIMQNFGNSPTIWALATGLPVTLGTAWARYSVSISMPSTIGKLLGATGGDCSGLTFWYSSGATNNAIAGNIGVQSGTISLWGVQLEIGSVATPLEKPDPRYDLANCQRFYSNYAFRYDGYGASANMSYVFSFPSMRASPTVVFSATTYTACSGLSTTMINSNTLVVFVAVASVTTFNVLTNMTLSADL